jgi:hypothetical protein
MPFTMESAHKTTRRHISKDFSQISWNYTFGIEMACQKTNGITLVKKNY